MWYSILNLIINTKEKIYVVDNWFNVNIYIKSIIYRIQKSTYLRPISKIYICVNSCKQIYYVYLRILAVFNYIWHNDKL